jgi:DNA-directed RNA polymerase specialized sigma24 family protein
MFYHFEPPRARSQARLNRFALCIAASTDDAYSALEDISSAGDLSDSEELRAAFQRVVSLLDLDTDEASRPNGQPPHSLVARFSCLTYHQRVAFALVVIEEFPLDEAAAIMNLEEEDIRQLLLAVRDFLFTSQWSVKSDA